MTYIANLWDDFISALLKPFNRAKENKLKLAHTIEMDKLAASQRHVETILDSQKELVHQMKEMSESSNLVLREWLEGFHKLPVNSPVAAPPVNDDERLWRMEMQGLAREAGKNLTENMSPYEIEAVIREGFNVL
jgi:hypothetical protein